MEQIANSILMTNMVIGLTSGIIFFFNDWGNLSDIPNGKTKYVIAGILWWILITTPIALFIIIWGWVWA